MPTKKISDKQRLITYAAQATEEQLSDAIETLQAIRAGRFPKERRKSATPRKTRTAKPTASQPELPAMPPKDEAVTDEQAGELLTTLVSDSKNKTSRRQSEKFTPDPEVMRIISEEKQGLAASAGD
jgi:hypothetical protein